VLLDRAFDALFDQSKPFRRRTRWAGRGRSRCCSEVSAGAAAGLLDGAGDERGERDGLGLELDAAGLDAGHVEDGVDLLEEVLAGAGDGLDHLALLGDGPKRSAAASGTSGSGIPTNNAPERMPTTSRTGTRTTRANHHADAPHG
jgi:hypothetical protein